MKARSATSTASPLLLALLVGAAGCSVEAAVVLTIDARPTVHGLARLSVAVTDEDGDSRQRIIDLGTDRELGKTLTIATEGRDGLLTIEIDALGDDGNRVALGSTQTAAHGNEPARVLLAPTEFAVNTRIAGAQRLDQATAGAQLAVDDDGSFAVVWHSSARVSLFARLFDATAAAKVNAVELTSQEYAVVREPDLDAAPAIARSADHWLIAWEGRREPPGRVIRARSFALADAAPQGGDETLFDDPDHTGTLPVPFALGEGFGVAWVRTPLEGAPRSGTIAAVALDLRGRATGPVVDLDADPGTAPEAVGLADGGALLVWEQDGDTGIVALRVDATLTPQSPAPIELGRPSVFSLDRGPRAAALPDGGAVIAWTHSREDGTFVALQRMLPEGAIDPELIEVATASAINAVDVAARADGTIAVAWHDGAGSSSDHDVLVRVFAADGDACGPPTRVNLTAVGPQTGPSIEPFGLDGFVVAWTDGSGALGDIDDEGIAARVVYPDCPAPDAAPAGSRD